MVNFAKMRTLFLLTRAEFTRASGLFGFYTIKSFYLFNGSLFSKSSCY
jgi:hypothetical protein